MLRFAIRFVKQIKYIQRMFRSSSSEINQKDLKSSIPTKKYEIFNPEKERSPLRLERSEFARKLYLIDRDVG